MNEKSWFLIFLIFSSFYFLLLMFLTYQKSNLFFINKMNLLQIFYYKLMI